VTVIPIGPVRGRLIATPLHLIERRFDWPTNRPLIYRRFAWRC
jgi:hypothetical protein